VATVLRPRADHGGSHPLARLLLAVTLATLVACPRAWAAPGFSTARPTRGAPRDTARLGPLEKAEILQRWGEDGLLDPSVESRQRATRDLNEAIRLDPTNPAHWITLGHVCLMGELLAQGRDCFDRAVRLAPHDPRTHMERGRAWQRDWVRGLDTLARNLAAADYDTVTQLRPNGSDGWLALVPMRYERGDLEGAARAAERALAGRPRRVEAGLAVAYTAYRLGDVERADSMFRATIPRLTPSFRSLFENAERFIGKSPGDGASSTVRRPRPQLSAHGSVMGDEPAEEPTLGDTTFAPPTAPEVWAAIDPDPTTPENEVRLEFYSRVAHAYFVFWDPLTPVMDSRADLYIRYGPPRSIEINPAGVPMTFKSDVVSTGRATSIAEYPMGVVRWNYPELGMGVVLNDRSLHGRFEPAVSRDFLYGSTPDPATMSHRGDLMALDGGRAVFPTLPSRDLRIEVAGLAARFESSGAPRLFAQVQAFGSPLDTLTSRWVVLDSTGRDVAHGGGRLALSACDPGARQLTELSQDLPPGHYRLALSVRDGHRRKGLFRTEVELPRPVPALELSDVVLSCGDPTMVSRGPGVRLDANVESLVKGPGPLAAYFEIYRLAPAADGMAHFEVEYAVRRLSDAPGSGVRRPRREPALLSQSSRQEAQVAGLRRQFVSVPVLSLTPGRYQLEIRVRDVTAGTQVERSIAFDRE
jgi:GWxTD domain-containing protein